MRPTLEDVRSIRGRAAAIAMTVGAAARAVAGPSIDVTADVGIPDGGVVSVEYRPRPPIALSAGVGHNLVSTGFRAGVAYALFHHRRFSPVAAIAYGHYPDGDANSLFGDTDHPSPLLEHVGYDFADLDLGFETGSCRVRFYLLTGVSRVTGTVHGVDELSSDPSTTISVSPEPSVDAWVLSLKLGLAVYL